MNILFYFILHSSIIIIVTFVFVFMFIVFTITVHDLIIDLLWFCIFLFFLFSVNIFRSVKMLGNYVNSNKDLTLVLRRMLVRVWLIHYNYFYFFFLRNKISFRYLYHLQLFLVWFFFLSICLVYTSAVLFFCSLKYDFFPLSVPSLFSLSLSSPSLSSISSTLLLFLLFLSFILLFYFFSCRSPLLLLLFLLFLFFFSFSSLLLLLLLFFISILLLFLFFLCRRMVEFNEHDDHIRNSMLGSNIMLFGNHARRILLFRKTYHFPHIATNFVIFENFNWVRTSIRFWVGNRIIKSKYFYRVRSSLNIYWLFQCFITHF